MKQLTVLLTSFTIFFGTTAFSQTFEWTKRIGGMQDERSTVIENDGNGGIYIGGRLLSPNSTFDADPGPGITILPFFGMTDAFFCKYDLDGNLLWAKTVGGPGTVQLQDIATDASSNVYITGNYTQLVDFDSGSGLNTLTSLSNIASGFVAKYDANGIFQWAKGFDQSIYPEQISIQTNTNVIIAGFFISSVADLDPGLGVQNFTNMGFRDIFVVKLDASGDFVFAKQIGGAMEEFVHGMSTDVNDNILITGSFQDTIDADPGPGIYNLVSPNGQESAYMISLDPVGNLNYANHLYSSAAYTHRVIGDNEGNTYTSAEAQDSLTISSFGVDTTIVTAGYAGFIIKCDPLGNLTWVKMLNPMTNSDWATISGMTLDDFNRLYLCGYFSGSIDFDPGSGMNLLTSSAESGFVMKLDENGAFLWSKMHASGGTNPGTTLSGILLDSNYDVHCLGHFLGTTNFDLDTGPYNVTALGYADVYITKYSQCAPQYYTNTVSACDSYTWNGNDYLSDTLTAYIHYYDTSGCDSLVRLDLTVNQTPINTVTQNVNILEANAVGVNYQWVDCENAFALLSGETNQLFIATTAGQYAVIVSEAGCADTSDCLVPAFLGIQQLTTSEKELVKIIDFMGRETEFRLNTPLIFIYKDGTRERVFKLEE